MNRFVEEVQQPYWWISVVAVGLVLSLVGSYLRSALDRGSRRLGGFFARRVEIYGAKVVAEANQIRGDPEKRLMYVLRAIRIRVQTLSALCASLVLLAWASLLHVQVLTGIAAFMSAIMFVTVMAPNARSNVMEDVLKELDRHDAAARESETKAPTDEL